MAQDRPNNEQRENPEEPSSGAAALRRAVDAALLKAADAIAVALIESSMQGHILSTKFVYELAQVQEKDSESESARKLRINIMNEWETDRKWLADLRIGAVKAAGLREPD